MKQIHHFHTVGELSNQLLHLYNKYENSTIVAILCRMQLPFVYDFVFFNLNHPYKYFFDLFLCLFIQLFIYLKLSVCLFHLFKILVICLNQI